MSKTIYFIVPYPKGEAPSQRFRFEQYIDLLEKEGFHCEVKPFIDLITWQTIYKEGKTLKKVFGMLKSFARRWLLLFQLKKADYLFIHREMAQMGPPIFEWIVAKILKRKYIYDFDDAIWLPNYSESNAKFHKLKAYWKVNYCMQWAHQITAGNDYLAEYAHKYNPNVVVLPTTIDTVNHHNKNCNYEKEIPIIGWTGTHTTMHYLDFIIPVLKKLEKEFSFKFRVISNEKPQFDLASLEFVKWKKETEIEDLAALSIGVMPLKEDLWSNGKCGFKALQYMSLGIPTLLSPVGVNAKIVTHQENGLFATSQSEWESQLRALLESAELRKTIGTAGKKRVENAYSVNSQLSNYIQLFQQ